MLKFSRGSAKAAAAAFGLLAFGIMSSAQAASPGWITVCPYSHTNSDDPIKFPGAPGAAHLHDFFGATTTNFASTYDSLRASTTTCVSPNDKAAYWVPELRKNGTKVVPAGAFAGRNTREKFYYRKVVDTTNPVVEPFPAGFKMITGYQHATSLADANAVNLTATPTRIGAKIGREIYWGCSDNPDDSIKNTAPVDCAVGIITLHVGFPTCWNGVKVDGDQIAANTMRWNSSGRCPAGFTHNLPRLIQRFEWPVGTSSGTITFSSGSVNTAHADFWNAWDQSTLEALVRDCLTGTGKDCSTDPRVTGK